METKTMLKIEDLKKDLYIGDLGEYFVDYNWGCVCDIISEIADNQIDIYNSDLLNWVANDSAAVEYCDRAKDELGANTLMSMIQSGQYLQNTDDLYENLKDSLEFRILEYIERDLKIKEIEENKYTEILVSIDFTDSNQCLESMFDIVNEILEGQN